MESPRSLVLFLESCRTEATKKSYRFELDKFLTWTKKDYESILFLEKTELTDILVDYTLHLKKRVSPNSLPVYFAGIFKFLDMNDKEFNKKKIIALFGEKVKRAGGRPITNQEINEMIRVSSNSKQNALIHVFSATGCRPEAITTLKIKHVKPIGDNCLSLMIYAGSTHESFVFLHHIASESLKRYHKWREDNGEKLTPESFVFIAHRQLSTAPIKPLDTSTVSGLFADLFKKAGIQREIVSKRNYDLASCGGFRKRFNTIIKSNSEIPYAVSEKLMDHSNYLEKHYFKSTREELFEHYKKAIPRLIFDESEKIKLENENNLKELKELEQVKEEKDKLQAKIKRMEATTYTKDQIDEMIKDLKK
jgi:hypothetical protein